MEVNLELYKVFYYVAETLSFSEAAKKLYISQSAVSQSIKMLESRLDKTLFKRSTKRVTLTTDGELLFKHIEPALNLIERGESQLIKASSIGASQLRIASSDTICRYFLVPFLDDFHRKFPNVHIKVTNGTSYECAKMLELNKVDMIVTNSPNTALNNTMTIEPIKEFQDVFILNPKYYPVNEIKSLHELLKHPILMLTKNSTTSEFLHNICLKHSLNLVPEIEIASNDLLIDLARIGLGIAFVPDFCLKEEEEENLVRVNIKEVIPKRTLISAYNGTIPLSPAGEYFINKLGQKIN
ncbi:MAG: LysR family transcriptional regulator [Clostridiales bacterium]|nr:LysR family transcriptional regulator [Clostridiales bacterium]